jgi:predicted cupin superfamily sugar epimerase
MKKIEEIISKLNLEPHPEGGFFKETYRSAGEINLDSLSHNYKGKRNYSTSIYFMLTSDTFSAFHRILQDEIWHFYDGSTLNLYMITPEGKLTITEIGKDISAGQVPQFVVPGGNWFAASGINKNDYSLVGCTVSPGFNFLDFELTSRKELLAKFPQHADVILSFTRA